MNKIEDRRISLSSIDEFFSDINKKNSVRYTKASSPIDEFFSDLNNKKRSDSSKVRIAGIHNLAGFEMISDDKLVRVSQQDFWKLGQDDEGYYVERLVNDDDGPVKY